MSEINDNKSTEKKIYSEARGKYSLIDDSKIFYFEFPLTCSQEENYAALTFIKDKLLEAIIQNKDKATKPQDIVKE
jgi:hypothetical protein